MNRDWKTKKFFRCSHRAIYLALGFGIRLATEARMASRFYVSLVLQVRMGEVQDSLGLNLISDADVIDIPIRVAV